VRTVLLLIAALLLAAVMALAVLAYQWWGGWGVFWTGLALLALLWLGFKLLGAAVRRWFLWPFRVKGQALRDAAAVIHRVTVAEPPAESADDSDGEGESNGDQDQSLVWYHVDVTVVPSPDRRQFHWEPGELLLSEPTGSSRAIDRTLGEIREYHVWRRGDWETDEQGKHEGAKRLRLHVGVPPGTRRACLRYYFEMFGEIEFPAEGA
jgi:hypothetical protein